METAMSYMVSTVSMKARKVSIGARSECGSMVGVFPKRQTEHSRVSIKSLLQWVVVSWGVEKGKKTNL